MASGVARKSSLLGTRSVRLLTFGAGGQTFALAAEAVAEVVRLPQTTRVPHAPEMLLGLANLRGTVVPIISASMLLGRPREDAARVLVLAGPEPLGLAVSDVGEIVAGEDAPSAQVIDVAALLSQLTLSGPHRRVPRSATPVPRTGGEEAGERIAFVTFVAGGQRFALPLTAAEEVLPLPEALTIMPHADDAVVGSIPRRGTILPLLSLRALLSLPGAHDDRGRVVVVRIGAHRIGLVVEAMGSVLRVPESEIDPVPQALSRGQSEARIQAICRTDGGRSLISVLAADALLREDITSRLLQARAEESEAMGAAGADTAIEQLLLFRLGTEQFAFPIAVVEEVTRLPERLAKLPKAPAFVKGVINLRGQVVPVIDQGERFGAAVSRDKRRRVVVAALDGLRAGFIVDEVTGVVGITADRIDEAPSFGSDEARVFERVARLPETEQVVLVVSPRELLGRAERELLQAMSDKAAAGQS